MIIRREIMSAVVALLCVSCAMDYLESEVVFSTDMDFPEEAGVATRAGASTLSALQERGFSVSACITDGPLAAAGQQVPNFMYSQKVEHGASGWTYDPVKYWPHDNGKRISFFAWSPSDGSGTGFSVSGVDQAGAPKIYCSITSGRALLDIVTATAIDQTHASNPVNLSFCHILTRLRFMAKVSPDNLAEGSTLYVTSAVLNGVVPEATYAFPTASGLGTWSDKAAPADHGIDDELLRTDNIGAPVTSASAPVNIFTDTYVYLIPDSSPTVGVTFTYQIRTIDSHLTENSPAGCQVSEYTKSVALPASIFGMGKSALVTFIFGTGEISLDGSPVIYPWTVIEESDPDYDKYHISVQPS